MDLQVTIPEKLAEELVAHIQYCRGQAMARGVLGDHSFVASQPAFNAILTA